MNTLYIRAFSDFWEYTQNKQNKPRERVDLMGENEEPIPSVKETWVYNPSHAFLTCLIMVCYTTPYT